MKFIIAPILNELPHSHCLFIIPSGITNLRFKPTYNPYTEPSMEVFSYHEGMSDNLPCS